MSASGTAMMRVVKPGPEPVDPPFVIPAPKMSSVGKLVDTFPLLAVAAVPDADAVLSNGVDVSSPLYLDPRALHHILGP